LEALGSVCRGERDRSSFDILGDLAERTTDAQCLPAQELKPFRRAVSGAAMVNCCS